jgi:hypothetical protein
MGISLSRVIPMFSLFTFLCSSFSSPHLTGHQQKREGRQSHCGHCHPSVHHSYSQAGSHCHWTGTVGLLPSPVLAHHLSEQSTWISLLSGSVLLCVVAHSTDGVCSDLAGRCSITNLCRNLCHSLSNQELGFPFN